MQIQDILTLAKKHKVRIILDSDPESAPGGLQIRMELKFPDEVLRIERHIPEELFKDDLRDRILMIMRDMAAQVAKEGKYRRGESPGNRRPRSPKQTTPRKRTTS